MRSPALPPSCLPARPARRLPAPDPAGPPSFPCGATQSGADLPSPKARSRVPLQPILEHPLGIGRAQPCACEGASDVRKVAAREGQVRCRPGLGVSAGAGRGAGESARARIIDRRAQLSS